MVEVQIQNPFLPGASSSALHQDVDLEKLQRALGAADVITKRQLLEELLEGRVEPITRSLLSRICSQVTYSSPASSS